MVTELHCDLFYPKPPPRGDNIWQTPSPRGGLSYKEPQKSPQLGTPGPQTPAGMMLATFLGAIATFEAAILKERIKAGMLRAKRDGIHCGRPRVGFDIGKALELKRRGWGVRRIAKEVGVSYGTVHRVLKAVTEGSNADPAISVTEGCESIGS